jgi:hypothetical protein
VDVGVVGGWRLDGVDGGLAVGWGGVVVVRVVGVLGGGGGCGLLSFGLIVLFVFSGWVGGGGRPRDCHYMVRRVM